MAAARSESDHRDRVRCAYRPGRADRSTLSPIRLVTCRWVEGPVAWWSRGNGCSVCCCSRALVGCRHPRPGRRPDFLPNTAGRVPVHGRYRRHDHPGRARRPARRARIRGGDLPRLGPLVRYRPVGAHTRRPRPVRGHHGHPAARRPRRSDCVRAPARPSRRDHRLPRRRPTPAGRGIGTALVCAARGSSTTWVRCPLGARPPARQRWRRPTRRRMLIRI